MNDKLLGTLYSKTFWFNAVVTMIAILELAPLSLNLPEGYLQVILFISGILNIILRVWFTSQSVQQKVTENQGEY